MPKPLHTRSTESDPLTHKVKLIGGRSYTLVDSKRPTSPWKFEENVPRHVPEYVAKRLKDAATDNITQTLGRKTTGVTTLKFEISKLATPASSTKVEDNGTGE